MTKKLLQKSSKYYLLFSVMLLIVFAPVLFFITDRLYIEETDETLLLHKNEFLKYSLPNLTTADIEFWNKYNRNVKIEPNKIWVDDTIFYKSYYDTLEAETEPYRELNSSILIDGNPYTYSSRINLVEREDLMKSIALFFLLIISLLLVGLYVLTKRLSVNIWRPFYETLDQIEKFEVDKSRLPRFTESDIEEFDRLNRSIEKLVKKNISIYHSQREFVENAAHELQTPLAVFQAKIDTLIQSSDFTAEQFRLLSSINDSVSRLNRLNKNLLLLSKIENDNFNEIQEITLNEAVEKHLDFFSEQAKAKNLNLKTEFGEIFTIRSNPVLLEILLNNLFMNAISHNVNNGQILVSFSINSITFSNTGIPHSLVPDKLFNRFSKTNPSEQGNGLGLAISKKITDLYNWRISYSFTNNFHSFTVSF